VNLPGDNIDTLKKNTETLTDANKEVGVVVNIEKTRCMLLSCLHNTVQKWHMNIANR
jgi:hypothetical protein